MSFLINPYRFVAPPGGLIPLDADTLLKHTKTSSVKYTKTDTSAFDGYAYLDTNNQVGSEIECQTTSSNTTEVVGFYDKTLVDATEYKNFNYCIYFDGTSISYAIEEGVIKYSEDPTGNSDARRLKKTSGACEYYVDDILIYTSLQDFTGSQFGCLKVTNGHYIDNVNIIL